jgi:hypothetical protein
MALVYTAFQRHSKDQLPDLGLLLPGRLVIARARQPLLKTQLHEYTYNAAVKNERVYSGVTMYILNALSVTSV